MPLTIPILRIFDVAKAEAFYLGYAASARIFSRTVQEAADDHRRRQQAAG